MDSKTDKLKKLRENKTVKILYERGIFYCILSFLIPSAIMLYAFYKESIHPFGDKQMLVVDLWHQYFPFFKVVREKLLSGGSFFYSWRNGMGTNFLALIAYYAASPLNWLSIFFGDESVRDALTYILIAKVGFSGLFCNIFLRYTYRHRDISTVFFACMFALCSYTLGYYWNVMWFDTIALFPLVMTGITAICRERKWKLYTIALALSLISNYYVGYFTCLFTVFMFICTVINEAEGVKDGFYKLWLIFRSSLIGAGLGAFILIPAYCGLQLTYSVNNTFPKTVSWAEKWQDIFANLISYSEPTHLEGLPNFACGMLAVMLFGVFLFSGGIKIREKICGIFLLALIAVSCNMNMLNFIWHGFHITNQLPYRYSFIFSFVLVSLAYRAYDAVIEKGVKIYQILLLIPAPCAVVYLNYLSNDKVFDFEGALKSSIIISAAYLLVFSAARIFPFRNNTARRTLINIALIFAVTGEMCSNAVKGVGAVGSSGYSSYPAKNEEVRGILSEIAEDDISPFYRTEMTYTYTLNDSALYGYTGVSQFSSSANVSVSRLFRRLGLYASEAGNRYYYRISTPLVNSLLGLKYIISKSGKLNTEEAFLEYKYTVGGVCLYENKYPLSFGFMVNEDILEMEDSDAENPFEYQNKLFRLAAGTDDNLYTAQPVALVKYDNMNVVKGSFGNYTFSKENTNSPGKSIYSFNCMDNYYLYGYATSSSCESADVRCDDLSADSTVSINKYPIVFPMGNGQSGSTAEVTVSSGSEHDSGSYKLMIYALDKNVFDRAYESFADEQLNIDSFEDTRITGSIDVKSDGILYMPVPYEKGLSIYVDGEKSETFPVLSSLLGVRLSPGHHDIKLSYTPEGFKTGLLISCICLALFVMLAIANSKKKNIPYKGENHEKSESNDGLQGDEIPRIPKTGKCGDGSGDTGEAHLESPQ